MGTQLPLHRRGTALQFLAHICCGPTDGWIKMPLGMEVGLGRGLCVRWDQAPHSQKGGGASQFLAHVYCGQTAGRWMDQDDIWHVGGPWSTPYCARRGPSSPSRKRGRSPNFRPMSIVDKRLYVSEYHLHGGRPQPRQHCVRWGQAPHSQKGGGASQFLAHVYCGQTAGWIKMTFGT